MAQFGQGQGGQLGIPCWTLKKGQSKNPDHPGILVVQSSYKYYLSKSDGEGGGGSKSGQNMIM